MSDHEITMEEVHDPAEIARSIAQFERGRKNSDWLESHWHELLPEARGRFVAVAGQEAFVADTAETAWESAQRAHPDDNGAFVKFIPATLGPRIYAHRR